MDLDALRKTLAYLDGELIDCPVDDPIEFVVESLRAVLDSEEGSYCETHGYPSQWVTATNCRHGAEVERPEECDMSPIVMVRVRLLAEEGT